MHSNTFLDCSKFSRIESLRFSKKLFHLRPFSHGAWQSTPHLVRHWFALGITLSYIKTIFICNTFKCKLLFVNISNILRWNTSFERRKAASYWNDTFGWTSRSLARGWSHLLCCSFWSSTVFLLSYILKFISILCVHRTCILKPYFAT